MRIAVYARRSTEEHQAASLEVQRDEALRFVAARGWTLVETHEEDAVSRAEFVKRPALIALLNGARAGRFEAVVMRDETRLGGDLYRTGMVLQDLHDAGVQLWYYATAERVAFDDPTSKLMAAVKLYASELERVKIASRTREHLQNRARRGLVVGGRVYGYDTERDAEGVRYVVNVAQAEVVRELYARGARGESMRSIASDLNARGIPSPRAGARGTGSWSPSEVRVILGNARYRGVLEWGRVGASYKGGTRVAHVRPEAERVRVEAPELALVTLEQWSAVHDLRREVAAGPRKGREPRYLLTGLVRCDACGGPLQVSNSKSGKGPTARTIRAYHCGWARDRGAAVCTNSVRRPVEEVDACVLEWLRDHALRPAVVRAAVEELRAAYDLAALQPTQDRAPAEAEARRLRAECGRLAAAIAAGDAPGALLQALREREARVRDLEAQVVTAQPAVVLGWDAIEREVMPMLDQLQETLTRNVREARAALATILPTPLRAAVERPGGRPRYRLTGTVALPVRLFATPTGSALSDRLTLPVNLLADRRAA